MLWLLWYTITHCAHAAKQSAGGKIGNCCGTPYPLVMGVKLWNRKPFIKFSRSLHCKIFIVFALHVILYFHFLTLSANYFRSCQCQQINYISADRLTHHLPNRSNHCKVVRKLHQSLNIKMYSLQLQINS